VNEFLLLGNLLTEHFLCVCSMPFHIVIEISWWMSDLFGFRSPIVMVTSRKTVIPVGNLDICSFELRFPHITLLWLHWYTLQPVRVYMKSQLFWLSMPWPWRGFLYIYIYSILLLLLKVLQLQRSFGLPNQFFPFGAVFWCSSSNFYFNFCYAVVCIL
jgi:hypothetical protein